MLYIASALNPTPILHTLKVDGLVAPGVSSLVVAKPDRIELWDVGSTGLVQRAELPVWGAVVGLDKVITDNVHPHFLVLLSPPNAQLLLVTYSSIPSPSLVITSATPLSPPSLTLRKQEYFTGVIADGLLAIVALWTGVLSCVEIEVEKDKDAKKRRTSHAGMDVNGSGNERRLLKFKDSFNLNIREHNLLSLAFAPDTAADSHTITFLSLSPNNNLFFQPRSLSLTTHAFTDLAGAIDVVCPLDSSYIITDETNYNDVPFSCPAARRVLAIPNTNRAATERYFVVIGDEHCVLYSVTNRSHTTPRKFRSGSGVQGTATSPRANAVLRSPQSEMTSGSGKRRKSSMTGKGFEFDTGDKFEVKPVFRIRQGFGTVLAETVIESHSTGASVLIGDECGRLTAIGWEFEASDGLTEEMEGKRGSVRVRTVDLGVTPPPSSIVYLDNSHIFVSSACGDSSLFSLSLPMSKPSFSPISPSAESSARRISSRGKGKGRESAEEGDWVVVLDRESKGSIETRERWMNIAPVRDFCPVVEEDGSLSHLVVASGASNANSLRIVRSGVGMDETLSVEGIEGVERIFKLSSSHSPTPTLLLSTGSSTSILQLDPDIAEVEISDAIASQPTLAAGTVTEGTALIQVTPAGVFIWSDVESAAAVASAPVETTAEIVCAHVMDNVVVAGLRGGVVVVSSATANGLEQIATCKVNAEVSAVSVLVSPTLPSTIIAIATWSNEILVSPLDQLHLGDSSVKTLPESSLPVSLFLKPCSSKATSGIDLLAGLSDGSMVTYELAPDVDRPSMVVISRRALSLGNYPLQLHPASITSSAEEEVVAIGISDRLSVFFESRDRVDVSSSGQKGVTAAAAVSCPSLGDALILATAQGLSFTKITSLKKLQVQTLDLGPKSVGQVAWIPEIGKLALGTATRTLDVDNGDIIQSGSFELRDATSLELLADFDLEDREEITTVEPAFLSGRQYVAVGTAIFSSEDAFNEVIYDGRTNVRAEKGRLLVLEPVFSSETNRWDMGLFTEVETVGPVLDIKVIHGFLAVAAASKVSILRHDLPRNELTELSHFNYAFVARYLAVSPRTSAHPEDRLVVGDGMRSIFVLDVDEESGAIFGDQRDLATHAVSALGTVADDGPGVIISNSEFDLFTFRLKDEVETAARFGLHEDIARFRSGSFAPASSATEVLRPDLIFATIDGRLGMVGELTPTASQTLVDLQRNMNKYIKGPGGVDWKTFRQCGAERIKRDTAGFIDGDFVQTLLDSDTMPPAEVEKCIAGTTSVEHVSVLVEGVKKEASRADVVRILEAAAGLH